jgi:hypothetical protein
MSQDVDRTDEDTQLRPVRVDGLAGAARTFLGHPSARLLSGQVLALAALRSRAGRARRIDSAIVAAVAVYWPLQEWFAHRYILHARPRRIAGRMVDPSVARLHREHHANPWRNTGLPMSFLVPAVPVHAAVWALLTRNRRLALTGMLAFSTTTLAYEWTHFLTHTSYRPKRSYYRKLQRRHRLHHFKDEHNWLGFTVPFVDDLFGTAPDPSTVPTSPTVRTLGIEDDQTDDGECRPAFTETIAAR